MMQWMRRNKDQLQKDLKSYTKKEKREKLKQIKTEMRLN